MVRFFETRKEAERYALEVQNRVNLGQADEPQEVTLHDFICANLQVQSKQEHPNITTTRKYYLAVRSEALLSANKLLNTILAKTLDD